MQTADYVINNMNDVLKIVEKVEFKVCLKLHLWFVLCHLRSWLTFKVFSKASRVGAISPNAINDSTQSTVALMEGFLVKSSFLSFGFFQQCLLLGALQLKEPFR